jgi:hypothetical protein
MNLHLYFQYRSWLGKKQRGHSTLLPAVPFFRAKEWHGTEKQRGHSTLFPAVPFFRAKEWHGTGSAEWERNLPFPESWEWSREYFS